MIDMRPMILSALAACSLLTSCASLDSRLQSPTFIVIRHAEKATDDPRDPTLSAAGTARAAALASLLDDERIVAAYATKYRRTQLTAAPAARDAGIEVEQYDADQPAEAFAAQLRATHPVGTVLVVGHSNTAPGIAAALCGCEVAAMDDAEYNRLQRIEIDDDGTARLRTTRY